MADGVGFTSLTGDERLLVLQQFDCSSAALNLEQGAFFNNAFRGFATLWLHINTNHPPAPSTLQAEVDQWFAMVFSPQQSVSSSSSQPGSRSFASQAAAAPSLSQLNVTPYLHFVKSHSTELVGLYEAFGLKRANGECTERQNLRDSSMFFRTNSRGASWMREMLLLKHRTIFFPVDLSSWFFVCPVCGRKYLREKWLKRHQVLCQNKMDS